MALPDETTRVERVFGLLLGAALGDAIGAPFEGRILVTESALRAVELGTSRLVHTDDTALTLVLAEHLAARAGSDDPLDEDALATEFAAAWRAEPWRGYGAGAARILDRIAAGMPWRQSSGEAFGGKGSYGNGGAMRVAPVAAVCDGMHGAADLGARSARVTHAHELGEQGAALQAAAVHLVLTAEPTRPLEADQVLDDLARVVQSRPWHEKLERVAELSHMNVTPEHAAHALGNDITALGSVPMALFAFLANVESPIEVIRYAVFAGGDTDTIAAMSGALAGARHGAAGFPQQWIDRLEVAERLRAVAQRLA